MKNKKPQCNKARKKVKSSVHFFPVEIIRHIFLKLPVNTLLRFKSVCKSWHAFISDPQLINSHLKVSAKVNYCKISTNRFSTTSLNKFSTDNHDLFETSEDASFPFQKHHNGRSINVLGSCNGLLLIDLRFSTLLWNPATGEYKVIARGINAKDYTTGLGYNSLGDEYKAVLCVFEKGDESHITIYSCSNRSSNTRTRAGYGDWEKVDVVRGFPYRFRTYSYMDDDDESGITFNGALHWAVSDSNNDYMQQECYNIIIYFDTAEEKFERLPTPSSWEMYRNLNVAVLEGCLSTSNVTKDSCYYNVWSMKQYGVKESWTKLFVIPSTVSFTPLIMRKKGNELVYVTDARHIRVFNKITFASTFFKAFSESKFGVVYMESLVSP